MQDQGVALIIRVRKHNRGIRMKGLVHNSAGIYYDYKNLNVTK